MPLPSITATGGVGVSSIDAITSLMEASGVPHRVTSTYRDTTTYHGSYNAVDFAGPVPSVDSPELDDIAAFWATLGPNLLELIYSGPGAQYWKNGQQVSPSVYAGALDSHHDHVHVAATNDGLNGAVQEENTRTVSAGQWPTGEFGNGGLSWSEWQYPPLSFPLGQYGFGYEHYATYYGTAFDGVPSDAFREDGYLMSMAAAEGTTSWRDQLTATRSSDSQVYYRNSHGLNAAGRWNMAFPEVRAYAWWFQGLVDTYAAAAQVQQVFTVDASWVEWSRDPFPWSGWTNPDGNPWIEIPGTSWDKLNNEGMLPHEMNVFPYVEYQPGAPQGVVDSYIEVTIRPAGAFGLQAGSQARFTVSKAPAQPLPGALTLVSDSAAREELVEIVYTMYDADWTDVARTDPAYMAVDVNVIGGESAHLTFYLDPSNGRVIENDFDANSARVRVPMSFSAWGYHYTLVSEFDSTTNPDGYLSRRGTPVDEPPESPFNTSNGLGGRMPSYNTFPGDNIMYLACHITVEPLVVLQYPPYRFVRMLGACSPTTAGPGAFTDISLDTSAPSGDASFYRP